ncbi:MAG TPA: transcription elongation factor NusA [Acidilobales archaeon]|nr:transcription elongation factor NusA [Acidilobales archaeon]
MRIPLDYVCVKSGILCPRCQSLVRSGAIEEFEVDLMKMLLELEEGNPEFRFLRNLTYVKAIKSGNFLVLMVKRHGGPIPHNSLVKLARVLSDRLGKIRVRVIDKTQGDLKSIATQLLSPARVLGINILWLPDGTTQHVIRVPRFDNRYLPYSREVLEQILTSIIGHPVRIRIE